MGWDVMWRMDWLFSQSSPGANPIYNTNHVAGMATGRRRLGTNHLFNILFFPKSMVYKTSLFYTPLHLSSSQSISHFYIIKQIPYNFRRSKNAMLRPNPTFRPLDSPTLSPCQQPYQSFNRPRPTTTPRRLDMSFRPLLYSQLPLRPRIRPPSFPKAKVATPSLPPPHAPNAADVTRSHELSLVVSLTWSGKVTKVLADAAWNVVALSLYVLENSRVISRVFHWTCDASVLIRCQEGGIYSTVSLNAMLGPGVSRGFKGHRYCS